MTTYTAIPNGDIDPESPITTGLMTLLRDNPIAITEGATGAPTIQTAAITDAAVTPAKTSFLDTFVAGNHVITAIAKDSTTDDTAYQKLTQMVCPLAGTVRVYHRAEVIGGTSDGNSRVYINDVAEGTIRTTDEDAGPDDFSEDFTVAAGDILSVWGRIEAAGTAGEIFVQSFLAVTAATCGVLPGILFHTEIYDSGFK